MTATGHYKAEVYTTLANTRKMQTEVMERDWCVTKFSGLYKEELEVICPAAHWNCPAVVSYTAKREGRPISKEGT